jgi:hypothetical protein
MHPNKIINILNLNTEDRYWYSIREIIKLEKVWAIANADSWITFIDGSGDKIFSIWPHQEAAEICALDELRVKGYFVKPIALSAFIKYCIPDMEENNIQFGVFFNENREALCVAPEKLKIDLEEELEGD